MIKRYYERTIEYNSNDLKFDLAAMLCENIEHYCLYENGDQLSIGINSYIEVIATNQDITWKKGDDFRKYVITDLNNDMEQVLQTIDLESWRAYGMADFDFSRYTYGLDLGIEKKELLYLFIPEIEYRISSHEILIRSLNQSDLDHMGKEVSRCFEKRIDQDDMCLLDAEQVLSYDDAYYKEIVKKGVEEIQEGKYKKVILSRKIPLKSRLNMMKTYVKGRAANTPARSYMCKFRELEIVGFSPETVAEVDCNGTVYTFPLAGTRALSQDPEKNRKLREELVRDSKEIAEHAISVKLAMEELEQVCDTDTVVVREFMSIMERGTVQHLGSRLRGQLREGKNSWHVFSQLFPAVTASGIPKREAIEAIGRIEKEPRDLYSGSILTYDSDGTLDAALVLRTVFQTPEEVWVRVGAGIVDMSNPEREMEETREKVSSVAHYLVSAKIG